MFSIIFILNGVFQKVIYVWFYQGVDLLIKLVFLRFNYFLKVYKLRVKFFRQKFFCVCFYYNGFMSINREIFKLNISINIRFDNIIIIKLNWLENMRFGNLRKIMFFRKLNISTFIM